jgi:hypothetical protein
MAYRPGGSGWRCRPCQFAYDGTGRLYGDGRCMRVESALARYVNRRRARVEWIQHQSMAAGKFSARHLQSAMPR